MGIPPPANDDFTDEELEFVRSVREKIRKNREADGTIGASFGDAILDAEIVAEYRMTRKPQ